MDWQDKNVNPPIVRRILVVSKDTNRVHIVHYDYDDWCLTETDEGFTGMSIEFDLWMPIPQPPKHDIEK